MNAHYVPVSMMAAHPHLPICSAAHVHPCPTNSTWTTGMGACRVPPIPGPCTFHQFPLASTASVSQLHLAAAQQQLLTHAQPSSSQQQQQQSAAALRDIDLAQRLEYERVLSQQHNYMLARQRLAEAAAVPPPPTHLSVSAPSALEA